MCTKFSVSKKSNSSGLMKFQLMLVDIAIQLSASITTYVAASEHFEIAFKIAAPQAAYWSFGPQYLMGSMFIFKMMGSTLIASGQHSMFLGLMFFISILTISLMISLMKIYWKIHLNFLFVQFIKK